MDTVALALLEAGILRIATPEQAAAMTFGMVMGAGDDALDDPGERFQAVDEVRRSWQNSLSRLPIPGVSLCQHCEDIDIEILQTPNGYMHSEDYWRLEASARECPMCALMVGALRGSYFPAGDFDTAMKLNHPQRADLKIILRVGDQLANEDHEIGTILVEIANMNPVLPSGKLWVFALPGQPPRTRLELRKEGTDQAF